MSRSAGSRGAPAIDHLLALRPLLWIPAIALFEAGRAEVEARPLPATGSLAALGALLALLAPVHLANAWRDRKGDRWNRKGGAVASGAIGGLPVALMAAGSMGIAALAAALPGVGSEARWLLVAALLLGAAYVTPPLELKRRAGFDLAAQALGYGVLAFLLGASSAAGPLGTAALAVASVPYALGIAAVGVVTMLADRRGDEVAGQRTIVVVLGSGRPPGLAVLLAVSTAAAGLVTHAWAPALWGIVAAAALELDRAFGVRGGEDSRSGPSPSREAARWNRIAIALQMAFLLFLLPRTVLPLAAAAALGAGVALLDRARGGAGYPLVTGRAHEEPSGGDHAGGRPVPRSAASE